MSVTKKEMFCLNLWKQSQSVSELFENITVKIRFIRCKYMKAKQPYFKYALAEIINNWLLEIIGVKTNG